MWRTLCLCSWDYVRVTPRIINQLLQFLNPLYDMIHPITSRYEIPIKDAVSLLTDGTIHNWDDLSSPHLSPTMAVLYNFCYDAYEEQDRSSQGSSDFGVYGCQHQNL